MRVKLDRNKKGYLCNCILKTAFTYMCMVVFLHRDNDDSIWNVENSSTSTYVLFLKMIATESFLQPKTLIPARCKNT